MGKRVEFSGRTVIGPGPNLPFGWMGVPEKIAEELTISERITPFNKTNMEKLITQGKVNFIIKKNKKGENVKLTKHAMFKKGTVILYGDVIIRKGNRISCNSARQDHIMLKEGDQIERDGKLLKHIYLPETKTIALNIGDVVHRHLQEGDTVLLNRQPTLHIGSMLAKKVKIISDKIFRIGLDTTKSFNADFDGDEMNIHVEQSPDSIAELRELSATKFHIISPQASKPIIAIVQDSLLGAYLMTKGVQEMERTVFLNITMHGSLGR